MWEVRRMTVSPGDGRAVHHLMSGHLAAPPDATALSFIEGESHTRRQLWDSSQRLATALQRIGVGPGDRVGTFMGNGVDKINTWLACSCIGAIVVPLNVGLRGAVLQYMLDQTEPVVLIAHGDH